MNIKPQDYVAQHMYNQYVSETHPDGKDDEEHKIDVLQYAPEFEPTCAYRVDKSYENRYEDTHEDKDFSGNPAEYQDFAGEAPKE